MTGPRFTSALITHDGLITSWADVPAEAEQEALVLSLIVQRADGSEVRFGGSWVRDAADSPVVFAWDSRTVQRRDHEAAGTAISRDGSDVRILFPRSWIDAIIDARDVRDAEAVVTVDGTDLGAEHVDLELEE